MICSGLKQGSATRPAGRAGTPRVGLSNSTDAILGAIT